MAQFALPNADGAEFNWDEGVGDGDNDHFDELDEGFGAGRGTGSGPDDNTYWVTTVESANSLVTDLSAVTDPSVSTGHIARVRASKNASGGRQLDLTFSLLDLDNIFTDTTNTNITNTRTTFVHNLSGSEADTIDSYGTLRISLSIIETGGGGPRIGECATKEFECPDAVTDIPPGLGPVVAMQEPHHHAGSGALLRY